MATEHDMDEGGPSTGHGGRGERGRKRRRRQVVIFWDYENVALPRGSALDTVFLRMRAEVEREGARLAGWHVYNAPASMRIKMQDLGLEVVNCERKGRKEAADHRLVVDCFRAALDRSEEERAALTVVLLTGDSDFAYAISVLRSHQITIWLFHPSQCSRALRTHAHVVWAWREFCTESAAYDDELGPVAGPALSPPPAVALPTDVGGASKRGGQGGGNGSLVLGGGGGDDDDDDSISVTSNESDGTIATALRTVRTTEFLMEVFDEVVGADGAVLASLLGAKLKEKYPNLVVRKGDAAKLIKSAVDDGLLVRDSNMKSVRRAAGEEPLSATPISARMPTPTGETDFELEIRIRFLLEDMHAVFDATSEISDYLANVGNRLGKAHPELFPKGTIRDVVVAARDRGLVKIFVRDGNPGKVVAFTSNGLHHARMLAI